jgi:sorbitol/mannitol transport system substrate-binding protein
MTMPDAPTWDDIKAAAAAMTDKEAGIYGICLRGKAGWGENMAFLTAMSNSFGARWFDENWVPQFDSPEWKAADRLPRDDEQYGPPGASNNGFNENLTLFQQGKCGMWIDATVSASFVTDPKESDRGRQVGFALAPDNGLGKRGNWLWAWSLAIPAARRKPRTPPRPSSTGRPTRTIWPLSRPRKAGPTCPPEPGPRFMRTRNTRRCPSPR